MAPLVAARMRQPSIFPRPETGAWGTVHYQRRRSSTQIRVEVAEGELEIAEVVVAGDASRRRRRQRLERVIFARPRAARTVTVETKGERSVDA